MKPFSFVHAADLHLGYTQYNMDVRREDFLRAFEELVDRTLELKPNFMIIAGDVFHHARPTNVTLENAIKNFRRLREAGIPVLAVDGSHDAAPNVITGTILNPLHSAGLITYLPRLKGACWQNENCYVYGVPNYRTRRKTEEALPLFYKEKKPQPNLSRFNIFVFHMAIDLPKLVPPTMEAEATPELIPDGFNYYAGGHVHKPTIMDFKSGILVYSGSTETVSYEDAGFDKGFFYVEVNSKGEANLQRIKLESPRRFLILKMDFKDMTPAQVTQETIQRIRKVDQEGVVIIPVLEGILPFESQRGEVDITKIRSAAEKALIVRPINHLQEREVSEEIVRSIFEGELKDLRTKSFEYFIQIFSDRHSKDQAEKIARLAVNLMEPLVKKHDERVKELLEGFFDENRNGDA